MDRIKFKVDYNPLELPLNNEPYELSKLVIQQYGGNKPVFATNEPLYLTICINYQLQSKHFGKNGINESGKNKLLGLEPPNHIINLNKIGSAIIQALNGIAFDESQIVCCLTYKQYAIEPSIEIAIERKPNGTLH